MDIVERLNTMCEAFLEIESEEIKYVQIQESSEGGYDYTLFDLSGEEYDGGIYEPQDETKLMGDALLEILEDSVEHYELIRILTDEEGETLLEAKYKQPDFKYYVKPNTSCYDYYTFQDLEEACIRAKTLSLTEFPVSLLYEPIETEDGWRMKEIFIYMKGRAIASERIRLHCSFYLRAGHKLN